MALPCVLYQMTGRDSKTPVMVKRSEWPSRGKGRQELSRVQLRGMWLLYDKNNNRLLAVSVMPEVKK